MEKYLDLSVGVGLGILVLWFAWVKFKRPKTVESILAPITKMVKDLENHAEAKYNEAAAHALEAARLKDLERDKRIEMDKATAKATQIKAVF